MIPLFRNDSYLAAHDTIADNVSEDGEAQLLSFRETLFTQGGGQPRDYGTVQHAGQTRAVEDLVKHKGDIRIRIATIPELKKGAAVHCELDFDRRFKIMRLHTAQHALAGALRMLRDDYQTAGMQISDDVSACQMKFRTAGACGEKEIREAMEIIAGTSRGVRAETFESADAVREHFKELYRPSDPKVTLKGKVRVIIIDGLDVNACGGTHLRNTSEIGGLKLISLGEAGGEYALKFTVGA